MKYRTANLFADAAPPQTGERFDTLLSHKNLVVERTSEGAMWLAVHLHPEQAATK